MKSVLEPVLIWLLGLAMGITSMWALNQKPEYSIELIDQNNVEVTNEFGKTYICHPDSIINVIDYDNR